MLRISRSISAVAATRYFDAHLQTGDYYTQGSSADGVFMGKGAERLGLSGKITREAFTALSFNRDPNYPDQRLTVRQTKRPGWDIMLSSPSKSFDIVRLHDPRTEAAFQISVRYAAELIESFIETRLRRGGQNGSSITGEAIMGVFNHSTTRPLSDGKPDPFFHSHVYLWNRTFSKDESRWQAVELDALYKNLPMIQAAFDSHLAKELGELGYTIERNDKGGWDVAGMPRTAMETYSRRTREIEAEAEKRGIQDNAKFKSELGEKTRHAKGNETLVTQELRDYWDSKLDDSERAAIERVVDQATSGGGKGQPPVSPAQAMEYAIEHNFATQSAVPVSRLLADGLKRGMGSITLDDLKPELEQHGLLIANIDGRQVATTNEVYREEQEIIAWAKSGKGRCRPLGDSSGYQFKRDFLNEEKRQVVREVLNSRNVVQTISGAAGTGKSTLLEELADALRESGHQVHAYAPTSLASRGVLRKKNFPEATTLAALLKNPQEQQAIQAGDVLIIDEASMAGARAIKEVAEIASKTQSRGLLVGDEFQHKGVPRGEIISVLKQEAGIQPIALSSIMRQSGLYRKAIQAMARGRVTEGFDVLDNKLRWIHESEHPEKRFRLLAERYVATVQEGKSALVVSFTHAESRQVEAAIRARLLQEGLLGSEIRTFLRHEDLRLSNAQKKDTIFYQKGTTVEFHQNVDGFRRGERVEVVDSDQQSVQVQKPDGKRVVLPLNQAESFQVARTTTLDLRSGDLIRITGRGSTVDGQHQLMNGQRFRVEGFSKNGDIVATAAETKQHNPTRWVIPKDLGKLQRSFVTTSHSSQGSDAQVVLIAASAMSIGATSRQGFYVANSRGKLETHVFTDDKHALREHVQRSEASHSASEVVRQNRREGEGNQAQEQRQRYFTTVLDRLRELAGRLRDRARSLTERHRERELGYER